MKKRFFGLVLALTMLASMFVFAPFGVNAETYSPTATVKWNGHTYSLYDVDTTWVTAKDLCE